MSFKSFMSYPEKANMSYLALAKQALARLEARWMNQQIPPPTLVSALRQALREWYAMTAREADGNLPTPEEAQVLLSNIRRLWDDVGPAFAEVVAREEARAYFRETGVCPYCGEREVFHDPELGGTT